MVKVFYEGCDIAKYGSSPLVVGFTTNTTLMCQSNQLCYQTFYEANKDMIQGRPISFQIFSDYVTTIEDQAYQIHSLGDSVYVTIPIINSRGESLLPVITKLSEQGIRVNITAVFTVPQLTQIREALRSSPSTTPIVVSVFGGLISDTGVVPQNMIQHAVHEFSRLKHVEVMWVGVKDNLILDLANEVNCHIVTLPDSIMGRINRIGQSLDNLSKETVASFLKDAVEGRLCITAL